MSKKEEQKLKVLTINEQIMGSMNEEIKDAIVTAYSEESRKYQFYDVEELHKLQENGNKDLELMKTNEEALSCYIEDRRLLLVTAYQSFVQDQVIRLASCITTSVFNEIGVYVDFDQISYILLEAFCPHPLQYAYTDVATENFNDLHNINHLIPNTVIKVADYLRRNIYSSVSNHSYKSPRAYIDAVNDVDMFIESTQRSISVTLTAIYCDIKDYVKIHSLPLGYPEYKLEPQEDGSLIPVLKEENNKDEK